MKTKRYNLNAHIEWSDGTMTKMSWDNHEVSIQKVFENLYEGVITETLETRENRDESQILEVFIWIDANPLIP